MTTTLSSARLQEGCDKPVAQSTCTKHTNTKHTKKNENTEKIANKFVSKYINCQQNLPTQIKIANRIHSQQKQKSLTKKNVDEKQIANKNRQKIQNCHACINSTTPKAQKFKQTKKHQTLKRYKMKNVKNFKANKTHNVLRRIPWY